MVLPESLPEIAGALVFNAPTVKWTQPVNVLLVSREIDNFQTFINNAKDDTFVIAFPCKWKDFRWTADAILQVLNEYINITTESVRINRLGIVFYYSHNGVGFLGDDTDSGSFFGNTNVAWLYSLVNNFKVTNVDFLASKTLTDTNWINYYTRLSQNFTNNSVVISACIDRSGDVKNGATWTNTVNKSTVEGYYFKSTINYTQYLLEKYNIKIGSRDLGYYTIIPDITDANNQGTAFLSSYWLQPIAPMQNFTLDGKIYNVTSVGSSAYWNWSSYITYTGLKSGITEIRQFAYLGTDRNSGFVLPNTVTTIGKYAFYGCYNAKWTIPPSVNTIGKYAFYNGGTIYFTQSLNVENIEEFTFYQSTINELNLPYTKSIGTSAFQNCPGLQSVKFSSNLETIGNSSFKNCISLYEIVIPSTVKSIGEGAFSGCTALTSVICNANITNIASNAFAGCSSLKTITIPKGITNISSNAFSGCTSLQNVFISSIVTKIDDNAFNGCKSLVSIYFYHMNSNTLPTISATAFSDINASAIGYSLNTVAISLMLNNVSKATVFVNKINNIISFKDVTSNSNNNAVFAYGPSVTNKAVYTPKLNCSGLVSELSYSLSNSPSFNIDSVTGTVSFKNMPTTTGNETFTINVLASEDILFTTTVAVSIIDGTIATTVHGSNISSVIKGAKISVRSIPGNMLLQELVGISSNSGTFSITLPGAGSYYALSAQGGFDVALGSNVTFPLSRIVSGIISNSLLSLNNITILSTIVAGIVLNANPQNTTAAQNAYTTAVASATNVFGISESNITDDALNINNINVPLVKISCFMSAIVSSLVMSFREKIYGSVYKSSSDNISDEIISIVSKSVVGVSTENKVLTLSNTTSVENFILKLNSNIFQSQFLNKVFNNNYSIENATDPLKTLAANISNASNEIDAYKIIIYFLTGTNPESPDIYTYNSYVDVNNGILYSYKPLARNAPGPGTAYVSGCVDPNKFTGISSTIIPEIEIIDYQSPFLAAVLNTSKIYNVVGIEDAAFLNCPELQAINIPSSITSIGSNAFSNCPKLTSITIPENVTIISDNALLNCKNLTSVYFNTKSKLPTFGKDAFFEISKEAIAYCYKSKLTSDTITLSTTLPEKNWFKSIEEMPASVSLTRSVIDGYIFGANITIAKIGSGGAALSYTATKTDINGKFTITLTSVPVPNALYVITSSGGADSITNLPVEYKFRTAVLGSELSQINSTANITPLSTIVSEMIMNNNALTLNVANQQIATAFKISVSDITSDYLANNNLNLTKSNVAIATIVSELKKITNKSSDEVSKNVAQAISENLTSSNSLSSDAVINSVLDKINIADGLAKTNAKTLLTSSITKISNANTTTDVYKISAAYQNVSNSNVLSSQNYTDPVNQTYINAIQVNVPSNMQVISNICFPKGTLIKTDQGEMAIDKINPKINTIRGKKIVAVTQTISKECSLICFGKDSIKQNIPSQRTVISQNHKVFYNGEMIKAKHFAEYFENVKYVDYSGETLYNVLLEEHDKMIVNNLICETLHPNNPVAKFYRMLNSLPENKKPEFIRQVNKRFTKKITKQQN